MFVLFLGPRPTTLSRGCAMVRHRAVLFVCLASVAANMYLLSRLKKPYDCAVPKRLGDVTLVMSTLVPVPTTQPVQGKQLASELVVFVGGCPRSGTTLARAMLDAHPDIRCGEETRILPRILSMASKMTQSSLEQRRLESGGVSEELLDRAIAAFMSEIIVGHGIPSKYLCNKDPLLLQHMKHIARMFPKAKFLLMIRDGRAVAHSIVSRNITISGVDSRNYLNAALFWNKVAQSMSEDCNNLPERCLIVFYEKLVSDPSTQMKEVLRFLDIPWHDNVLRHHEMIGLEVSLSK